MACSGTPPASARHALGGEGGGAESGMRRVSFGCETDAEGGGHGLPPLAPTDCVVSLGKMPAHLAAQHLAQHSGKPAAPSAPRRAPAADAMQASSPAPASIPEGLLSLSRVRPLRLPPVPSCFLCPISHQVMQDPVTAADEVTYDREHIMARFRSGLHISPSTGQSLPTTDLRPNLTLMAAIHGYVQLRKEAELQWRDLEANMKEYLVGMGQKLQQRDGQVQDLQRQVHALQGLRGVSKPADASSNCESVAVDLASTPPVLLGTLERSPEGSSCTTDTQPAFFAGPAPRSARGDRSTTPRKPSSTPRKTSQTPRGQSALTGLRSVFEARLTPRIAQMFTPRGSRH